ncbi:hypothetical protein C8F04DRAFT_987998 [Mycena alexandri]|uniref:DUF6534 domain-containing protein n=1 Tax=Mycena alexandri TaxID=1745969 RepID=A0AAD6TJW8_9AGAR|nr:hypothetical protein C8F04DRAFT_987998 [Mycena alexandri]
MSSFEVGKLTIPLFIGTVLNWSLLGVLAVQVYIYFLAFPADPRLNKLIVTSIFLLELLQTLGDSRDTIQTFGSQWGNPEALDVVGWAFFSVPILGSFIAALGQIFFAWRISIIGQTLYMPALIAAITVFQLGAGIWTGVEILQAGRFSLLQFNRLKPPVAWLSATAASDLTIVATTVFYMLKAREPEFRNVTNVAITRIIRVSVETGVLCAIFACVDLYLYIAFQGNNYHLAVCIWLSKVYSNSIMVILNSRAYIGHATPANATPSAQSTDLVFRSRAPQASAIHFSLGTESTASSPPDDRQGEGKVDDDENFVGVAV